MIEKNIFIFTTHKIYRQNPIITLSYFNERHHLHQTIPEVANYTNCKQPTITSLSFNFVTSRDINTEVDFR